jgi:hypothetical protein
MGAGVFAEYWLGVLDAEGRTWARIKFVNQSASPSNWAISNCRAAVSSDEAAASTDAVADWDGVVDAGATEYVWIYGFLSGDVSVDSADGGASAFNGVASPAGDGASGEWVITIANDGSVTASIDTVVPYGVPSVTGDLPEAE